MDSARSRLMSRRLALGLVFLSAGFAHGQDFPYKPVRIITAEPGGTNDFAARLIAQELKVALGQQVIVENRATGIIAAEVVSKALPDGYTLLLQGNILWLGPLLQKMPYDAIKDFTPISLTNTAANVLVVDPSLPARTVNDLLALAKARPGDLNYGSGATGASNHLAAELFKSMTGTNVVRVSYKGSGPILNALLGGEIQLTFGTAASVLPHVKAGRLVALGVTSLRPSELAPGLPTVAATVPGYESIGAYGIVAPVRTPANIISRVSNEIARIVNRPDVKEKFLNAGVETVGSSPEAFSSSIKAEIARLSKLFKAVGIGGQ